MQGSSYLSRHIYAHLRRVTNSHNQITKAPRAVAEIVRPSEEPDGFEERVRPLVQHAN